MKEDVDEIQGTKLFYCCLCGGLSAGYGNNPAPLGKGKCCDNCNTAKVIPARVALAQEQEAA